MRRRIWRQWADQWALQLEGHTSIHATQTSARYVTKKLAIRARGDGWSRWMHLKRSPAGIWRAPHQARGVVRLQAPGGDLSLLNGAMDRDVAWSP